jgi:chromosome segregation ATPase
MRIDIYHHIELENDETNQKLDAILQKLTDIQRKEETMSAELDALTVQVQATTDVENSAILLIQGIATQLVAIKDDPAKIAALSGTLKASADSLAAAIIANTPVAPPD